MINGDGLERNKYIYFKNIIISFFLLWPSQTVQGSEKDAVSGLQIFILFSYLTKTELFSVSSMDPAKIFPQAG